MDMEKYIEIKDLEVIYSARNGPVFTDLNLEFPHEEMVLIMGPNGGGKTTVIKSIIGLVKPRRGYVKVLGRDPITQPYIRREIGYVPQIDEVNIHAPITLWDFVSMGRYPRMPPGKRFTEEDYGIVEEAIAKVGLKGREDYRLSELSGGELARGMIARTFSQKPKIYLLDEPFESIDFKSEELIIKVLREEVSNGKLVILAEHHISDVEEFDRVIVFNKGVVVDGEPRDVINESVLEKAYGGD